MRMTTKQIIQRIGETDQLFLQGNTPELALERGDLRLQLVTLSRVKQEQRHFLQEAIVLLEHGRIEFEEMEMSLYLNLSLHLAKAYMLFFEITREKHYALITQQIMKALSYLEHADVWFFLAYASAAKQEPAMTRHWLTKYSKSQDFDFALISQHPSFEPYHEQEWFKHLLKTKMH
jgi:hypothetical protein